MIASQAATLPFELQELCIMLKIAQPEKVAEDVEDQLIQKYEEYHVRLDSRMVYLETFAGETACVPRLSQLYKPLQLFALTLSLYWRLFENFLSS